MNKQDMNYLVIVATCVLFGCRGTSERISQERATSVAIDVSSVTTKLPAFHDGKLREALIRYLAASGEWRETRGGGALVAEYERRSGVSFDLPVNSGERQAHLSVRFEPYLMKGWYENEKNIPVVGEGISVAHLKQEHSADAFHTPGTAFFIASSNLWFFIREWSPTADRPLAALALKKVSDTLKLVEKNEDSILDGDYRGILPDGSMVSANRDTITVKQGIQRGIYLVGGFVNPGEHGYVTIKAYRLKDGARLSEDRMTLSSLEYVGFSKDPAVRFIYESEIQIDEGDWSTEYPARFELWFHPDQGGERKLAETTTNIYGWQR